MGEEESVTVTRAAIMLKVSRSTVYRLLAEGKLHREPTPLYKRGGPQRIPLREVEALLHR